MHKFVLLFFLSASMLVMSCKTPDPMPKASPTPPAEMHAVEEPLAHVCILYYATDFKTSLKSALVSELNEQMVSVTVDGVANSDNHPPQSYDAVILLSGIEAFRTLPLVPKYIKAHDYAPNIVYFFGYTKFNWPYGRGLDKKKIDAVTCATSPLTDEALQDAAGRVMKRTLNILMLPAYPPPATDTLAERSAL